MRWDFRNFSCLKALSSMLPLKATSKKTKTKTKPNLSFVSLNFFLVLWPALILSPCQIFSHPFTRTARKCPQLLSHIWAAFSLSETIYSALLFTCFYSCRNPFNRYDFHVWEAVPLKLCRLNFRSADNTGDLTFISIWEGRASSSYGWGVAEAALPTRAEREHTPCLSTHVRWSCPRSPGCRMPLICRLLSKLELIHPLKTSVIFMAHVILKEQWWQWLFMDCCHWITPMCL